MVTPVGRMQGTLYPTLFFTDKKDKPDLSKKKGSHFHTNFPPVFPKVGRGEGDSFFPVS